jgi:hypothetical protein
MPFQLRIRITDRCPRHRYDPTKGEAAIKGGCPACRNILDSYQRICGLASVLAQRPGIKVTQGRAA